MNGATVVLAAIIRPMAASTPSAVEAYHRQLRKILKNKGSFSTPQAVRKILYLATKNISKKWTMPIPNWALILNQLAIRFEGRFPL